MADRGLIDALTQPAFPAAIDERDRHVGWFLLTIGAALVLVVALVVLVGVAVGAAAFLFPHNVQPVLTRISQLILNPQAHLSYSDEITALIVAAGLNTPIFILPVLLAAVIGRRRFRLYLTSAPKVRWRLVGWGMVLTGVLLLPIFYVGNLIEPTSAGPPILLLTPDWGLRAVFGLVALACLLPAAAAEEILFRGWLLRQSVAFARLPWIAILLNGVFFALAHVNPNLDDAFQLAMMGMAFAYMSLRLGGIEFAVGAHAINNILIVLFFEILPFSPAQAHPFNVSTVIGAFLTPGACVLVTELVLRWAPLRRLTGADEPIVAATPAAVFT